MAKRKWINKKTATSFQLVFRPQNDPLIHDETAPQRVLAEIPQQRSAHSKQDVSPKQSESAGSKESGLSKAKTLADLAAESGVVADIRANEGEAANYGIYFDDTEYDYMQHMRDLNEQSGNGVWVPASKPEEEKPQKGKGKSNAFVLRELEAAATDSLDKDILPSQNLQRLNYQNQQDVPDSIAGFQPDMNPDLREVLEALEDEAYVDDDEGLFQELAAEAEEVEEDYYYDEDDGWETEGTDDTAKPTKEYKDHKVPALVEWSESVEVEEGFELREENEIREDIEAVEVFKRSKGQDQSAERPEEKEAMAQENTMEPTKERAQPEDWMNEYNKFKDQLRPLRTVDEILQEAAYGEVESASSVALSVASGLYRKKRKGALTNPSNYSLTSASIRTTPQQHQLDAHYAIAKNREYSHAPKDDRSTTSKKSEFWTSMNEPRRQYMQSLFDDFNSKYERDKKGRVVRKEEKYSGPQ
jgi:protein LTV1